MKRTILNLLAVAVMSLCWSAYAAEAADPNQPTAEASAMPMDTPPETSPEAIFEATPPAPPPVAAPVAHTPLKYYKRPKNQPRPTTLDLRYCLASDSNVEIAHCAGE